MILQSCQNCWFNGLQYGLLGLPVGYCTRHKTILNSSDETTCGLHLRKDLGLGRATQVGDLHRERYPTWQIVSLLTARAAKEETSSREPDLDQLRRDVVGDAVFEYGMLRSKIASLARLRYTVGARPELAMLSLGRGYVANCVSRSGRWTSGLHLYWWTRERLAQEPSIAASDIRRLGGIQLSRQVTLTSWSLIMLRLTFVEDVATHAAAQQDPFGSAQGLLNQAAEEVQDFNIRTLLRWIHAKALPLLDKRLPYKRYAALAAELHRQEEPGGTVETDSRFD
jgi:hypothetical protein